MRLNHLSKNMLLEINYFRYVYNISSCYIYFILFNYIIITIQTLSTRNISQNPKFSDLWNLLHIVCDGLLDEFLQWHTKSNAITLANKYNIDYSIILKNLRLLKICLLCGNTSRLNYSDIAVAIQVDVDDVELWIVDAIDVGLIEGNMDQMNGTLTIR